MSVVKVCGTGALKVHDPGGHVGRFITSELRNLRREYEHALDVLPEDSPKRAEYSERLKEINSEEESRHRSMGIPIVPLLQAPDRAAWC